MAFDVSLSHDTMRSTYKRALLEPSVAHTTHNMEGTVTKQRPHLIKTWQERYLLLEDRLLTYTKLQANDKKGYLNFDLYACELSEKDTKDLIFDIRIKGCDRVFSFKCEDKLAY